MFASGPTHGVEDLANPSAELSNWDFLQDLDFVPEPDTFVTSLPQETASDLSASTTIKEKNRQAQKRFRQRKKEREQTIEAQLAETTSELHNLRLKQRELEARNSLLEKVAALNRQQSLHEDASGNGVGNIGSLSKSQADIREVFVKILEKAGLRRSQGGSALVLTGRNAEENFRIDDIAAMSLPDLAKLYTLYVRKMSICLLDIQDSINSGSLEQLQRFSLELSGLFVSFWIANPQHIAMLHSVNMQTGQVFQEAAPENLHKDLLVALKCTESQVQDTLHLRRLFYSKLGQLGRQRAALMSKIPHATLELQHTEAVTFNHGYRYVADKLVETTEVAEQLCANRYEESQVYMYCGFCLFRCIHTSVQHAVMLVNPYPRPADSNTLMELLAQKYNEPTIETLLASSGVDDLQHIANWETVVYYASSLDASNVHQHAPFLKSSSTN